RATAAHEGDDAATRHGHAVVLHHRAAFAVLEADILELDLVHDRRSVDGVRTVGLVVLHREDVEHPLHRGERALQLAERVHDVPDRAHDHERVPLEYHDVADRRAALEVQPAAV